MGSDRRRRLLVASVFLVALTLFAFTIAAASTLLAETRAFAAVVPRGPEANVQMQAANNTIETSDAGSLEFVVNGVIGRALNIPGTF